MPVRVFGFLKKDDFSLLEMRCGFQNHKVPDFRAPFPKAQTLDTIQFIGYRLNSSEKTSLCLPRDTGHRFRTSGVGPARVQGNDNVEADSVPRYC